MEMNETVAFLKLYRARYGAYSMPDAMISIWHKRLKHLDSAHATEAFEQLLGSHDQSFGWKAVLMVVEALFPPESDHAILERRWKNNPISQNDKDAQIEMSIHLRGYMTENEEAKRLGKEAGFDWLSEYAVKFVEVLGRVEAERALRVMIYQSQNPTEDRFIGLVRDIFSNGKVLV